MRDRELFEETIHLTPEGVRRLRARIAEARGAYLAVCADNGAAAESGDSSVWHDNFAYEENQRQMHRLARQVRDLEDVLARATIVGSPAAPEEVGIGTRVRLRFEDDDSEAVLCVAGWGDGDPAAGRISYTAPVARALLGARVGEARTLTLGGKPREVLVLELLAGEGR